MKVYCQRSRQNVIHLGMTEAGIVKWLCAGIMRLQYKIPPKMADHWVKSKSEKNRTRIQVWMEVMKSLWKIQRMGMPIHTGHQQKSVFRHPKNSRCVRWQPHGRGDDKLGKMLFGWKDLPADAAGTAKGHRRFYFLIPAYLLQKVWPIEDFKEHGGSRRGGHDPGICLNHYGLTEIWLVQTNMYTAQTTWRRDHIQTIKDKGKTKISLSSAAVGYRRAIIYAKLHPEQLSDPATEISKVRLRNPASGLHFRRSKRKVTPYAG